MSCEHISYELRAYEMVMTGYLFAVGYLWDMSYLWG
jgi:hypothetical protein